MSHAAQSCCTRLLMGEQCCFGAMEKEAIVGAGAPL